MARLRIRTGDSEAGVGCGRPCSGQGIARVMTSSPAIAVVCPSGADRRIDKSRDTPGVCYVQSAGIRWRLLRAGRGPRLLLLHGTGSVSGSWAKLAAALATNFEILAPDLPGHGCSGALPAGENGLNAYAGALGTLLGELRAEPDLIIGHSAGAAIAARLALDESRSRVPVISINGALRPLSGWTAATYVPAARLLGLSPLVPDLLGSLVANLVAADRRAVRRLLESTGSRVDADMMALYDPLMRNRAHLAGTLRMLAHWDLHTLGVDLVRLGKRLTLIVGLNDRTVSPRDADWIRARVAGCTCLQVPGLGHLAHEEAPQQIASMIASLAGAHGFLDPCLSPTDSESRP